jgi:acetolactate synthase-1/2/3 large subunit
VCFATLGPGATNLVTGVADANMDRAPVVVLTGQADTRRLHKESHQAMDVLGESALPRALPPALAHAPPARAGMFKPIVKWNAPVLHPENIPEIVHKAFKLSKLEKPGACHIELSEDIAGMEATGIKPLSIIEKVRRSVPDDKIIDEIWSKLRQAKRPVVLAGNGCLRHKATKQLEAFVTALHIPVVMTFMGKGAISSKLAECCFTVGLASGDANNRLLDKSDFV